MKLLKNLLIAAIAVTITSCGGKKESKNVFDVKVEKTAIGGKLSEYFSLEDKTYKYKLGMIDEVSVELKCIKPLPENMEANIGVDVLNEEGSVIKAGKADAWSFSDYDVLRQATPGQDVTVVIKNYNSNISEEDTPAKIRLTSLINAAEQNTTSAGSESEASSASEAQESSSSETSSSSDMDATLDSYEEYVDQYISFLKKASKGDMDAMTEYPELMEKAQSLQEELSSSKGDMSAKQLKRYMKINNKMLKAAQNM